MTVIAKKPGIAAWESEDFTEEELITGDTPPLATTSDVLLDQNAILPAYTVIGRITTGGKLTKSVQTAVDGSQNPIGITTTEMPDTGADIPNVPYYLAGCFNPARLNWDATWNTDALKKRAFEASNPQIVIKAIV
jgi:hypothetical protein